jgi:hypothetical protein
MDIWAQDCVSRSAGVERPVTRRKLQQQNWREVEMDALLQSEAIVAENNTDITASSRVDSCQGLSLTSRTQAGLDMSKNLLEGLMAMDPNNAVIIFRLGEIHESLGESDIAAGYYNRFLALTYCGFASGRKALA